MQGQIDGTRAAVAKSPVSKSSWVSPTAALFRLVIGGLFVFAAAAKLSNPQLFADAVMAFKILPENLARLATFIVPWTELLAGAALLLGVWTRSAALLISLLLVAFIGGLVSVLARGLDAECSCFGKFEFPCPSKVGACQIIRNFVMLAMSVTIVVAGSGMLALDRRSSAR